MAGSHFRLIAAGVDIAGVNKELAAHPELWGQNDARIRDLGSVHYGVPDIWVRWRRASELVSAASFGEPHFSVFWPAWSALPSLHPIVRNLSHRVNAVQLGGILITKVPPGGRVQTHTDSGWHAGFYDTKLYLVLKANALCLNYCGGDIENFRAGDVWEYPNNVPHSVENRGKSERINVIICFRTAAYDLSQAR